MLKLLPIVPTAKKFLQPKVEDDKEIAASHFPDLQVGDSDR
jgi:hypothetical protein